MWRLSTGEVLMTIIAHALFYFARVSSSLVGRQWCACRAALDPWIGFSPQPERALGWWESATLHPAHVRPREEPIAKLGHGQEAGVGAEPLDGGKARIAAKEAKVQTGPGFHPPKKRRSLGKVPKITCFTLSYNISDVT